MKADKDARTQRILLEREIANLVAEQQDWYTNWVLPAAAEAKTKSPMSRFSGRGVVESKPLSLEIADSLGDTDPTDRFQKGLAHVDHLSAKIKSLRVQEAKLGKAITAPPRRQIDWVGRLERRARKILKEKT
jgi:hypothetical protein